MIKLHAGQLFSIPEPFRASDPDSYTKAKLCSKMSDPVILSVDTSGPSRSIGPVPDDLLTGFYTLKVETTCGCFEAPAYLPCPQQKILPPPVDHVQPTIVECCNPGP